MNSNNSIKLKTLKKLLLLGSVTTMILSGCCVRPKPSVNDEVIVIDNSSFVENPDGTFTVSRGWMLERMEMEQKLAEALNMCLGEEEI
jgi:hypothetical protein